MTRQQRIVFYLASAFLALLVSLPTWSQNEGRLTATVDRTRIAEDETLTLQVRYRGQTSSGAPDFSLLQEHFIIKNSQQANRVMEMNGVVDAYQQWTLTIAPRKQGDLLIPSFKYQNSFSDAIQVEVVEAGAVPQGMGEILLQTNISQSEAHVQEQVVVTYRLYTSRSIQSMDAEPLEIDGVRIEALPQTQYHKEINGVSYAVLEVSYALFPQTSGTFTVPSQRWLLRVYEGGGRSLFRFGGGRYELRRLNTEEKHVEVLPKPQSYPAPATWLPAKSVELSQQWSEDPAQLKVGEPVTRRLQLRARGLTASQLPPIPVGDTPTQAKIYPEQAEQTNEPDSNGVTGIRTEEMVVVPNEPGELTLPAIEITWWNTESDQVETARLPEQTLFVAGGGAAPAAGSGAGPADESVLPNSEVDPRQQVTAPNPATAAERPLLWQILAGAGLLLALLFGYLWRRAKRQLKRLSSAGAAPAAGARAPGSADEKRAFKMVRSTASTGNAAELRASLLAWAARRWPERPPQSLTALGTLTGDEAVIQGLKALDASLYGSGTSDFRPDNLLHTLETWRKQPAPNAASSQLRTLY